MSAWFGRALAWHARGHRFDPGILHQKSTVLRLKYGAFLFDFLEATEKISQMPDFAGAWTATPNSCCLVVFENINNRIVCFDIKQLGKQLKKLGMLIVQDAVWGRVTANRSAGKSTRYYADEFHLLLKEEQTAAYSVEIWKRFRKWGGIPTALTQNVKDLLASPEVSNIFENSDFVYMLNQANGDRQILAKQLNISPHQLSYVTHSGEGEGLLFFGNVILPFVDRFPTDLELYRIMTTKLGEVSEGQK